MKLRFFKATKNNRPWNLFLCTLHKPESLHWKTMHPEPSTKKTWTLNPPLKTINYKPSTKGFRRNLTFLSRGLKAGIPDLMFSLTESRHSWSYWSCIQDCFRLVWPRQFSLTESRHSWSYWSFCFPGSFPFCCFHRIAFGLSGRGSFLRLPPW